VLLAALALGLTLAGAPADERSIDRFLAELSTACDRNDRAAIAAMVHYPLKVLASGWIIPVDDRAGFVRLFDAFLTDEIRDVIAEAAARRQPARLPDVVSLGKGSIRLMRFEGRFKIIGITVPPPAGKVRAARRGTTTVSFRTGESTAAYTGSLAAGEHERYIVKASRNELLEVRVDRVRGREILAHVFEAATHAPVDARGEQGTRVWTGRIPANGDYLIDVARAVPAGDRVLTYWLTVSLR
jgi:hypothetical protein